MALKASTGLRNQILDTASVKTILANGFLRMYSGPVPVTADEAIAAGNTLLCVISAAAGAGLLMGTASGGALPKDPAQTWGGTNVAGGVASFYRHTAVGDTGVLSVTQARIQGTISTIGDDLNITAGTTLVNGAAQTLNLYQLFLPTL